MNSISIFGLGAAIGYVAAAIVYLFAAYIDHQTSLRLIKAFKGEE